MASTSINPIYVQARKFLDDKNFEDAISMLSELLESLVAEHGEKSLETARAYFEYGNALLTKIEDTPAEGLLGSAADDAKATAALTKILGGQDGANEVEDIIVEDSDEDGDDEDGGVGDEDKGITDADLDNADMEGHDEESPDDQQQEGQQEDEVDDLEIAWELLEVARSIYEENPSPDSDIRLSEVYVRIGDLQRINNLYDEALDEYKKSLTICDVICKASDRQYSDIHFAIAVTYIYKSGAENADKAKEKSSAKEHYTRAKESISLRLAELLQTGPTPAAIGSSSSSSSSSSTSTSAVQDSDVKLWEKEVADARELVDELTETIEALTAEIKELLVSGTLDPSMGVTTIGFGTSSSSSSSSSAPANFFGAASAAAFAAPTGANFFGNAASSCANPTNQFFQFPNAFGSSSAPATSSVGASAGGSTLQVKRKVKPVAALDVTEPLSNTQVQGVVDSTATNGISEKKQKVAEEI